MDECLSICMLISTVQRTFYWYLAFYSLNYLAFLLKIDHIYVGLFLDPHSLVYLFFCFYTNTTVWVKVVLYKFRTLIVNIFLLFFKVTLSSLYCLYILWIIESVCQILENSLPKLSCHCIYYIGQFVRNDVITKLRVLTYRHGISFI